jgi:hypothetical protein
VLLEAAPPADACPEVWLPDALPPLEEEGDDESALPGVPVDRLEPVVDAVLDALPTVLFCAVIEEEPLPAAEESCVPWVVEEFALEDAVSVLTELAAAVLRPEVEAAAAALVLFADPCT